MPNPKIKLVKFRRVALLILSSVFALSATGCSLTAKKTTTTATTTYVRIWRMDQPVDPIRTIIDNFAKANAKSSVKVTYSSHEIDNNYELEAFRSLSEKKGPDIWSIPNEWLADNRTRINPLPETNFVIDSKTKKSKSTKDFLLSSYPQGIYDQLIIKDSKNNDQVYGLPTNVDTLYMYYNPTIFKDAYQEYSKTITDVKANADALASVKKLLGSPPVTWTDLIEQEKYITKIENNEITRSTIAMGSSDNIKDSIDILELLMLQNGTTIISADRKNVMFADQVNTPSGGNIRPGERALDFYTSFANPNDTKYTWSASMPPELDAFGKGKVAMVLAYSDFGVKLKAKYPKMVFSTAAMPQVSAAQDPVNIIKFNVETITSNASSISLAQAFMKNYLVSSQVNSISKENKTLTPFKTDLEANAKTDFKSQQVLTGQSIFKLNRSAFDNAFKQMIVDVNQNDMTTEEAIKSASDKVATLYLPATPDPSYYESK